MDKLLKLDTLFVTKEMDEASQDLIIEGFANTTAKDRAGDIITESAWTTKSALPNYLKNPIILAYHDHNKPIGRMVEHEVTSKGLRIRAKISKASGDVYHLIKDNVLQAFSVGFRVLDADYDSATDIFVIKDLELHEISVVSIPCNQDSVFSISKSFDSESDCAKFKSQYTPQTESEPTKLVEAEESTLNTEKEINEEFLMDPKELELLIAKSVADRVAASEKATAEKVAAEKAAVEKAVAEESRIGAIVTSRTEALVADLEAKMKQGAEAFANKLAEVQGDVMAKDSEIKSILAARNNKMNYSDRNQGSEFSKSDLESAFILSKLTKKGMFDTKFGQDMAKAVNASSDITVSSDTYELEVTTNLYRDMQEMLVVQPLFREIKMTSASQVLPINPNATRAEWVGAAQITGVGTGRDGTTTGTQHDKALTEILLQTYKLAGKSYITDETEEDAIIPLLPLLRDQLVEAHALAIDYNFLNGVSGGDTPTGLLARAATGGAAKTNVTLAKADGSVKVTAKMVLQTRRGLGQWGLDIKKLSAIVSLDAYWDLLEDDEFSNLNEVGAQATKLTGQVGSIYGMPVLVSTQLPDKALSSVFCVIVNKSNYLVPRLRTFTVQSDYDVETQRRVIVSTQRLGFTDIISGQGVAVAKYAAAN